jgi:predicted nucleic acid-binding protein
LAALVDAQHEFAVGGADCEDNRVLDLVVEVGALLLVSDDVDFTSMSPWRGTPILRPREFVSKVDGMRRHRRRR